MLIVISPAKNLDEKPQKIISDFTLPDFLEDSSILIEALRKFTSAELADLFEVNPSIAGINFERFGKWHLPFTPDNAKQAVLLFNGEVYNGLKAKTLLVDDLLYAQNHLRILSGLYGILRPLDLIQPYRLEMGIKLKTAKAKDLYQFWGLRITEKLNEALQLAGEPKVLVNLASGEYMRAVNPQKLNARIINIEFMQDNDGNYKTIVVYTKKARGMMSRFIIRNRLTNPEDLKGFDADGYMFNPRLSDHDTWVFTRR
jgi:cytoplasmic iron level regulating protein YaaA (DUF328/UPF0246 family)